MHNIKRNKKIIEYLQKQFKRLKLETNLTVFFGEYILLSITATDALEIAEKVTRQIEPDILDNDGVLIETLKIIGIMEVSKNKKEFEALYDRKGKIDEKNQKQDLNDFDKILKGMLAVPVPEEKKSKKKKAG